MSFRKKIFPIIFSRLDTVLDKIAGFKTGNYHENIHAQGKDEITKFEDRSNRTAGEIQSREREIELLKSRINAVNEQFRAEAVERERTERSLKEQLRFSQILIDAIPVPIFYKDAHGVYRGCNKAFEEYLGRPREEVIGKTVYDMAPRELADTYYGKDKELFQNPGIQVYEYSVKHSDGTLHDVIFNKAVYTDAAGNIAGVIGAMSDITEHKRIEKALLDTNQKLQAVVHASPLATVAFDRSGTVTMWNPAAEYIFGWSEEEAVGSYNPMVTAEKKHEFHTLLERVLKGDSFMGVELRRQRKDCSIIDISVSSGPIRNREDQIVGIMSVIADITEHKRVEQAVQRNYDAQTAINWILNISLKNISLEGILKQTLDLLLSINWLALESKGCIFLVEADPNKLVLKARRGQTESEGKECEIVPFGKCLCGKAAARGEILFADSLDDRHDIRYQGISPHGHYCVPIMHAQKVLGVINLYLKEGHRSDRHERDFLSAIASALAGIIQRKQIEKERDKGERCEQVTRSDRSERPTERLMERLNEGRRKGDKKAVRVDKE